MNEDSFLCRWLYLSVCFALLCFACLWALSNGLANRLDELTNSTTAQKSKRVANWINGLGNGLSNGLAVVCLVSSGFGWVSFGLCVATHALANWLTHKLVVSTSVCQSLNMQMRANAANCFGPQLTAGIKRAKERGGDRAFEWGRERERYLIDY